jgi:hypothetical protein
LSKNSGLSVCIVANTKAFIKLLTLEAFSLFSSKIYLAVFADEKPENSIISSHKEVTAPGGILSISKFSG